MKVFKNDLKTLAEEDDGSQSLDEHLGFPKSVSIIFSYFCTRTKTWGKGRCGEWERDREGC